MQTRSYERSTQNNVQDRVYTRSQKKIQEEIREEIQEKVCERIQETFQTRIQTRSQSQLNQFPLYAVEIDFDAASEAWKKNKKTCGNGTYAYICGKITKSGSTCSKVRATGCNYCKMHNKNN